MFSLNLLVLDYPLGNDLNNIFVSDSNINYEVVYYSSQDADFQNQMLIYLEEHKDSYNLITTNQIISNLTPTRLNQILTSLIQNNENDSFLFDICYISKWLDKCVTFTNQYNLEPEGITLVRTQGAKGFDTLLFSPRGTTTFTNRHSSIELNINDYIVKDIQSNILVAISFTASLLNYDPLKAETLNDYVRTVACESVKQTSPDTVSTMYLVYFIIIVIIVLVLAYLLFKLGPFLSSSIDEYKFFDNPLYV